VIDPRPVAQARELAPFELDAFVIRLEGEFDVAERARLLDAFAVANSSAVVVIDFKRTRYIDSTVLECLVRLERALSERGATLLFSELSPEVRRIFDVCGFDRLFNIRRSLGEVMNELDADAARVRRLTLTATPADAVEMDGGMLK